MQEVTNDFRSPSPLPSKEEENLTPTSTLHPPQLPLRDALTLSVAETSHAISDSLHDGDRNSALDQVYGDIFIRRRFDETPGR